MTWRFAGRVGLLVKRTGEATICWLTHFITAARILAASVSMRPGASGLSVDPVSEARRLARADTLTECYQLIVQWASVHEGQAADVLWDLAGLVKEQMGSK